MTTETEFPQEQIDRLLSVFMSGFTSGITTLMLSRDRSANREAPLSDEATEAVHAAVSVYSTLILDDPAVRRELGVDLAKLWTDGTAPDVKRLTAHLDPKGGGQG